MSPASPGCVCLGPCGRVSPCLGLTQVARGAAPDTGSLPGWPREKSWLPGPPSSRTGPHALEALQGGAPDWEAHPSPTPPKWPASLATSCWPSWTALVPCGWFLLFVSVFAWLSFFSPSEGRRERTRVGAGKGQAGIPWCDTAIKRTCFADSRGPCSVPSWGGG